MVRARGRHLNYSRRKVRPVATLVKGRSVEDALVILAHTPRRPAAAVAAVIKSAQANAKNNHRYRPETMLIDQIFVTNGRRLRRWRKSQRQYNRRRQPQPYQRQTCHLEVVLIGQKRPAVGPAKATASKPSQASATENDKIEKETKGKSNGTES